MENKELLELAAKAAGIRLEWDGDPAKWVPTYYEGKTYHTWNPLTDDGDALRLAVKLKIDMEFGYRGIDASYYDSEKEGYTIKVRELFEDFDAPYAATRRAIVCAAAEIGRTM